MSCFFRLQSSDRIRDVKQEPVAENDVGIWQRGSGKFFQGTTNTLNSAAQQLNAFSLQMRPHLEEINKLSNGVRCIAKKTVAIYQTQMPLFLC